MKWTAQILGPVQVVLFLSGVKHAYLQFLWAEGKKGSLPPSPHSPELKQILK